MDSERNDQLCEAAVRNAIGRIVRSSGDTTEQTSAEVVDAIYSHALLLRASWSLHLFPCTTLLTRPFLISVLASRQKLILLNRIYIFLTVSANTPLMDPKSEDKEEELDDADMDAFPGDVVSSSRVARFLRLCGKQEVTEEQIRSPPHVPVPLSVGHQLRLLRINFQTHKMSTQEYLNFAKLRQSASLSSSGVLFTRWLQLKNAQTGSIEPQTFQLIAHLFTSCLVDLIDVALFNRRKLGISMTSPITPIEVQQASLLIQRRLSYAFL